MEYVVERGLRWLPESSWQPVFQRSIDAFYEGKFAEGAEACRTLLNAFGVPDSVRELTYRNQIYYSQPLPELIPGATWQPLVAPGLLSAVALDPSPAVVGNGLVVLLRAPGSAGIALDAPPGLRQEPDGLEIIYVSDEDFQGLRLIALRPFFNRGVLRAGIVAQEQGDRGQTLAGVITLTDGTVTGMQSIGPRQGNFEQGWSPVLVEERERFIAWWEPTEVFELDEETGAFERVALRMAPHIAERFRGGSQGVPVPGGYLYLVNESVDLEPDNNGTLTRFVRMDESFQITDVSAQFFVQDRGNDVASGLVRQDERLIAGFTSGGNVPLLVTMDLESVLTTLIPMDAPGPRSVATQV